MTCLFIFFSFFFTFFAVSLLSPFYSKYHHCYYYKLKILNCTQYRDSNNTKGNDEKMEKTGEQVSPQQREMKKTDTQIQTPTK
jgi:hypothetical protein